MVNFWIVLCDNRIICNLLASGSRPTNGKRTAAPIFRGRLPRESNDASENGTPEDAGSGSEEAGNSIGMRYLSYVYLLMFFVDVQSSLNLVREP